MVLTHLSQCPLSCPSCPSLEPGNIYPSCSLSSNILHVYIFRLRFSVTPIFHLVYTGIGIEMYYIPQTESTSFIHLPYSYSYPLSIFSLLAPPPFSANTYSQHRPSSLCLISLVCFGSELINQSLAIYISLPFFLHYIFLFFFSIPHFSVSLFPVIVLFLIYFVRLYTHFSVYARAAYTRIHCRYLLYMTSSK